MRHGPDEKSAATILAKASSGPDMSHRRHRTRRPGRPSSCLRREHEGPCHGLRTSGLATETNPSSRPSRSSSPLEVTQLRRALFPLTRRNKRDEHHSHPRSQHRNHFHTWIRYEDAQRQERPACHLATGQAECSDLQPEFRRLHRQTARHCGAVPAPSHVRMGFSLGSRLAEFDRGHRNVWVMIATGSLPHLELS